MNDTSANNSLPHEKAVKTVTDEGISDRLKFNVDIN